MARVPVPLLIACGLAALAGGARATTEVRGLTVVPGPGPAVRSTYPAAGATVPGGVVILSHPTPWAFNPVHHPSYIDFFEEVLSDTTDPVAIEKTYEERFATDDYVTLLTRGASMPEGDRNRILARLADLIGLRVDMVARAEGRITIETFTRELLRDERKVLGLYDTTITATDPFPDREEFTGPDPTRAGITPAYTAAINRQLRSEIGVATDREYLVQSQEVNRAWRNDAPERFFTPPVGATDDLRYGLSLNAHMKAFITHGRYDLVTPYYASERLRSLMRLDPEMASRLSVRHFGGGHMFYAWEQSRRELTAAIAAFVADAIPTA